MWLIAILFSVILGVYYFFKLPYDYIKYKTSPYYKKERKKYKAFAGSSANFKIYNEIIKNELPIEYIENPEEKSLENGKFVLDNILIIPNVFFFKYDNENKTWDYCVEENGDILSVMPLDDYLETEIEEVNKFAGKNVCKSAVVLTYAEYIDEKYLAKSDSHFLVYDNDLAEVLKDFCDRNTK